MALNSYILQKERGKCNMTDAKKIAQNAKVILMDLDETLFREDKTISEYSMDVLERCRKKGLYVGFATSRGYNDIQGWIRKVNPDVVISSGGAYVLFRGEPVYESLFSAEEIRDIIATSRRLCGDEVEITVDTIHTLYWNQLVSASAKYTGSGTVTVTDFNDFKERAFKISVNTYEEEIAAEIAACVPACRSLKFSDIPWYTFSKSHAMKESGIAKLAEYLHIPMEEMIAFGDDYSDMGMLKACGLGIAMGNAIPPVKEVADLIIGTNTGDGVAHFLEETFLR